MEQRISSLQKWMKENDVDSIMLQSRPNTFYVTGFDTDPHERLLAVFLFQEKAPFIICPGMEINQIQEVFKIGDIIGYNDSEDPWEKIQEQFLKVNISPKKVAVENELSWQRVKAVEGIFPLVELVEVNEAILNERVLKTDEELKVLRAAAKLADFGVETGIAALEEGVSEMEVLAKIEYELKKKGVREMSFSTMVLFGEKGGDPHGNPGDRKLKKGDSVLFDLGVVWEGYCSDITRTVFFDHVKEEDQVVYETVLQAQEASLFACKPGNKISLLDNTARDIITNNGYGEFFPHRIGHGLGIEVHEFPSLNDQNNDTLKPGMTFTIEPGIYVPNKLGVRIEDDVVITEDGFETLTQFPKALTVVPSK
ncbi:Xaa-Pro peptidase family protein [Bacillus shivajii]|uniref:M24 family metallopeptidase n=1 Tax=Bacillus shivajii TaxID=1983719 RepID=UPI001CFB4EBC|nr:Xaa-Pro peptidase family protein [Bacillus shivajii]UCZ55365.1 Xaa-Pro peptidase family protein [Bacillus shivajii]